MSTLLTSKTDHPIILQFTLNNIIEDTCFTLPPNYRLIRTHKGRTRSIGPITSIRREGSNLHILTRAAYEVIEIRTISSIKKGVRQ